MYFQQTSADSEPATDRFKGGSSYEEMLKNRVLYRVSIARTIHFSELAPPKRSETVVSAASLKVHEHKSAGIGIEFKVCTSKVFAGHVPVLQLTPGLHTQIVPGFPLPMITSVSPFGRAVLSGNVARAHLVAFSPLAKE